uniref:Helix-turn-helix domain-containing protein n=1 Tax=candidate division WOR-3 bacterium TaxID=2052148 RepID=A0A7V3ZVD6_UNCW3
MNFSKVIGNLLKELRKERGLTLKNIAYYCKKNISYLSKLEKGKIKEPSINLILNYLRALHIPFSKFFSQIDELEFKRLFAKEKKDKRLKKYLLGIRYQKKPVINYPQYLAKKIENLLLSFNIPKDLIKKYGKYSEKIFEALSEGKDIEKMKVEGLDVDKMAMIKKLTEKAYKREIKRKRQVKPITDEKLKKMAEGYEKYQKERLLIEEQAKQLLFNKGIKVVELKDYLNQIRKYHSLKRKKKIKKILKWEETIEKSSLDKEIIKNLKAIVDQVIK